jgi:hypothetical protein
MIFIELLSVGKKTKAKPFPVFRSPPRLTRRSLPGSFSLLPTLCPLWRVRVLAMKV